MDRSRRAPLEERFAAWLRGRPEALPVGATVLVALSGGVDSVVLLHLLRFGAPAAGLRLHAAHLDHGMRRGSDRDAAWVRGLCRAWDVPLHLERSLAPLRGEADAREARYAFLRAVAAEIGAARIVTAHHADDQAETVLLRAIRGTGPDGLSGIPHRSGPLVRPLLGFRRAELESWARAHRLAWREDPTNRDPRHERNRVRHEVLPLLESIRPGAAAALARLAAHARADRRAWRKLLGRVLREAVIERSADALVLARPVVLGYHPPIQARLLRAVLRRYGSRPDQAGTRAALEFIRSGASGRSLEVAGGLRLHREFDRIRLEIAGRDTPADEPLVIPGPEAGGGELRLGGRRLHAEWGGGTGVALCGDALRFPLALRGWLPGDRIRLAYGTKRLKRLLAERRVPRGERGRVPLLVDSDGNILWVAGIAVAADAAPAADGPVFHIALSDAEYP